MKRPDIIQGGRAEFERELLEAMFTLGAEPLTGAFAAPPSARRATGRKSTAGCLRDVTDCLNRQSELATFLMIFP